MNSPAVSVVIPAYNCEKFIGRAIQSVLQQSFTDFEVIIINDGSVDRTEEIIKSFSDKRISYYRNEVNAGLAYTLNRGIDLARGVYIARMDGDDVALPARFEKQLNYLRENNNVDILATVVSLINEEDQDLGVWEADVSNVTEKNIRRQLVKDNCIAHPSVMGNASIFKNYKFDQKQSQAEDYDLWLRMAADNLVFHKLSEPLLLHRILSGSFTRTRKKNIFWKNARTKLCFAWHQVKKGKLSLFTCRAFFYGCLDLVKGIFKQVKVTAQ